MKREKQLSSSRNESSRDSRISLGIENLVPPAKKLTEEIPSERCCQSWCEANRRTRRLHEGVEMHYEKCTSSWKGKVCSDIVVVVDSCPHPRASSSYRRETQTSSWAGWRLNSLRAVVIRLGQSFAFGAAGCARCRRGSAAVFIRRNAINRRNLWKRQVDKWQVCSNFLIISQLVLILPTTRKHFDDKVFFSSFFFFLPISLDDQIFSKRVKRSKQDTFSFFPRGNIDFRYYRYHQLLEKTNGIFSSSSSINSDTAEIEHFFQKI